MDYSSVQPAAAADHRHHHRHNDTFHSPSPAPFLPQPGTDPQTHIYRPLLPASPAAAAGKGTRPIRRVQHQRHLLQKRTSSLPQEGKNERLAREGICKAKSGLGAMVAVGETGHEACTTPIRLEVVTGIETKRPAATYHAKNSTGEAGGLLSPPTTATLRRRALPPIPQPQPQQSQPQSQPPCPSGVLSPTRSRRHRRARTPVPGRSPVGTSLTLPRPNTCPPSPTSPSQSSPNADPHHEYKLKTLASNRKLIRFFGQPPPMDIPLQEIKRQGLKAMLRSRVPLCYFLASLVAGFCGEGLFCYLEMDRFETMVGKRGERGKGKCWEKNLVKTAGRIYDTYLAPTSPLEVNLDHRVRTVVTSRLQSLLQRDHLDAGASMSGSSVTTTTTTTAPLPPLSSSPNLGALFRPCKKPILDLLDERYTAFLKSSYASRMNTDLPFANPSALSSLSARRRGLSVLALALREGARGPVLAPSNASVRSSSSTMAGIKARAALEKMVAAFVRRMLGLTMDGKEWKSKGAATRGSGSAPGDAGRTTASTSSSSSTATSSYLSSSSDPGSEDNPLPSGPSSVSSTGGVPHHHRRAMQKAARLKVLCIGGMELPSPTTPDPSSSSSSSSYRGHYRRRRHSHSSASDSLRWREPRE